MLSRTASELYWMSRHLERAENTARMLDVTLTMSLMPSIDADHSELVAPLTISGTHEPFLARYGQVNMENLLQFFCFDEENPSSIFSCLRMARDNAHAVRGKIPGEVWESINAAWIEIRRRRQAGLSSGQAQEFFDWIKERSHQFRGATYGTIMRGDVLWFLRLGTFIERADNTARILTVKYQVIREGEDSVREFYRWNALLRSVGAYEAHQTLYKTLSHASIAELLILRNEVPRSLRACLDEMELILAQIEGNAGQTPRRLTTILNAHLTYGAIDDVFALGMQAYLSDFLSDIGAIGQSIHAAYLEVL
ncbi:alpha-E domain-containing protein [Aeromonas caviae]|uniref:alpha-E domain-containing protein n=1 Tax=Aeromonas caviae TaxID=648 RepID=UPI002B47F9BA|nr:alpha-E domain-containing protein [Aeromonas caviae]